MQRGNVGVNPADPIPMQASEAQTPAQLKEHPAEQPGLQQQQQQHSAGQSGSEYVDAPAANNQQLAPDTAASFSPAPAQQAQKPLCPVTGAGALQDGAVVAQMPANHQAHDVPTARALIVHQQPAGQHTELLHLLQHVQRDSSMWSALQVIPAPVSVDSCVLSKRTCSILASYSSAQCSVRGSLLHALHTGHIPAVNAYQICFWYACVWSCTVLMLWLKLIHVHTAAVSQRTQPFLLLE